MNRRELFKGLGAALVAASIPISIETLAARPTNEIILYLQNTKLDLIQKMIYPPCIMKEDGTIEVMSIEVWQEALHHVNLALKELRA